MGVPTEKECGNGDVPLAMRILLRSCDVHDTGGLLELMKSAVSELLRHEAMVCGYHVISSGGNFVHNVLQYNYPDGYVQALNATEGRVNSPLMERWRVTKQPVLFQSGRDDAEYPKEWVDIFKQYELRNVIGHGVLDEREAFGSYFVFARLPGEVGNREINLLKAITPHLHLALMRAVAAEHGFEKPEEQKIGKISERQKEILRLIYHGKTNREIAQILLMSQKNVSYHIEKIFTKLGVRSRAQAASKAVLRDL